jgi:hypothetical protein
LGREGDERRGREQKSREERYVLVGFPARLDVFLRQAGG